MMLTAHDLTWRAQGRLINDKVSLDLAEGEFLGIAGPNGSGKSTLLSMLSGLRRPASGHVTVMGTPMTDLSRRDIARRIAVVEQHAETSERLTARQVVELGRTPHLSILRQWSSEDDAIVSGAIAAAGMQEFETREWLTLSGGEKQRLQIARALAQQPAILILDEPTNHLDIEHQIGLLDLVSSQGLSVIAALHDLNHAAMFCDRLIVMDAGRIAAQGRPGSILTPDLLARVFKVEATVETGPEGECHIRYARPSSRRSKHPLQGAAA
ncbi:ABC transporter ATP-binding protein [Pannonibacter sp. I15F10I1]|uniref:ABC transporter ATP-binding protein n=1 Tax=Pannonibacter sp. I15F10I1 TaxID=2003580 RepID=UPI0016488D85|nr:ABC transporter ATP-binding protein [Pannonibacter sp. I15F10I1]